MSALKANADMQAWGSYGGLVESALAVGTAKKKIPDLPTKRTVVSKDITPKLIDTCWNYIMRGRGDRWSAARTASGCRHGLSPECCS